MLVLARIRRAVPPARANALLITYSRAAMSGASCPTYIHTAGIWGPVASTAHWLVRAARSYATLRCGRAAPARPTLLWGGAVHGGILGVGPSSTCEYFSHVSRMAMGVVGSSPRVIRKVGYGGGHRETDQGAFCRGPWLREGPQAMAMLIYDGEHAADDEPAKVE